MYYNEYDKTQVPRGEARVKKSKYTTTGHLDVSNTPDIPLYEAQNMPLGPPELILMCISIEQMYHVL